jgi:anionic cell wall polymer biosynthesis LytR-Cps2A-Psr (LCP) family protein
MIVAVGVILAVYTLRSDPVEDSLSGGRVINALFVIEKERTPVSTYVLMYYPVTKRAAIFDIPGELGLLIARINRFDRIDTVYDSERISGYENEIEKLLGIEIGFSIIITRENLASLVDLLEGIEIFIPSPVSYKGDGQVILFPSGLTVLDGDKAAAYAVYSLPDEDNEMKVFRRQRFFLSVLNRWFRMNDYFKNKAVSRLCYSFLRTEMSQRTLARLFDEFANIDMDRTNIQAVSGNPREVSGQTLLIPHWDGNLAKEVVRQTLGQLTRRPDEGFDNDRNYTVEVLNGTAITGLAGRTAEMLRSFGYDVIAISNADRSNYEATEIIHRLDDESMVKAFADIIRCNNIRSEAQMQNVQEDGNAIQNYEYKPDLTLVIGRDFNGRYVIRN